MKPIVAIVGRPNVGKSTLFNRLAGKRLAIVDDQPGVTRDRNYVDAFLHGRAVTLVDTGGFDPTSLDPMGQGIARQAELAIQEADVVMCVLDGSGPPTEPDREAVKLLRHSGKPVVYVTNKADNATRELEAAELYTLGIDPLLPVSALHGRGIGELEQAVAERLPPAQAGETPDDGAPRVALIGRPNAGKSSLFNTLCGEERALVDSRPGTTRDPIDSRLSWEGQPYVLVDTAGIRKRSRVDRGVEAASVMRSIRMIDRAEVIVLLCDAALGVAEQDQRLLGLCAERGRPVVVALNKSDLLNKAELAKAEEAAQDALRFAPWATILHISAKTGRGTKQLMDRVFRAAEEFKRRVPTGELNRFFEQVLEHHPPPTSSGKAPRIYYITQAETAPPVFVAMCSAPDHVQVSYKRFVVNQIRKHFGFECVPIVVRYRGRDRKQKA